MLANTSVEMFSILLPIILIRILGKTGKTANQVLCLANRHAQLCNSLVLIPPDIDAQYHFKCQRQAKKSLEHKYLNNCVTTIELLNSS